jgi:hypothetical protein
MAWVSLSILGIPLSFYAETLRKTRHVATMDKPGADRLRLMSARIRFIVSRIPPGDEIQAFS